MKLSLIVPFQRGREYLRDCLESLKDQRLRIYLDEVEGSAGFSRLDRLQDKLGFEGLEAVYDMVARDDLEGLEALRGLVGLDGLMPYITVQDDDLSKDKAGADTSADEGTSDTDADEEEIRPFIYVPYRDFEVILIKDHAVDDIDDIVAEYSSEYTIRVLELKDGTGVGAARNLGIEAAQGEYILFLDSDDYLFPRALYFMDRADIVAGHPDIIYGKKTWTWYSRNGFMATYTAQKEQEEEDAQADGSSESAGDELSYEERRAEEEAREAELMATLSPEEYIEHRREQAGSRLISKRKGLRNVSALNIAYKRSFVEENSLRFPTQFKYFADLSFVCDALEHATTFRKNYKAWYIKRKHNDPINFPSLAQEKDEKKFNEWIEAYRYSRGRLAANSSVLRRLDVKFINYFACSFVVNMRRNPDPRWMGERFDMIREAGKDIPKSTVKTVKLYKRRLFRALMAGDKAKCLRIIRRRLGAVKLIKGITNPQEFVRSIYVHRFMKKPVENNWILFECFFGKSYGDSPKAIYEYIAANYGDKYKLIWSMEKGAKCNIPYAHKVVRRQSLMYSYYVARCKFFVFNTKQPGWMIKRDGQVFLETWHGTPLKRLAFDMEDNFSAAPGYKKQIYANTRDWDYLVSANGFSSEVFKSCFMFDKEMLEFGYPRNDILHRPDRDQLARIIRKKLHIPLDKKTILYAPTWRDDEFYAAGQYKFTLKLELPKLKEALGDEYVILLRTHYYIADKLDVTGMEGFAYNLSKYPDIADIYLISDICITDYSSVFFDYANLKRPMLFYTYDIDKYRDMLRGFYFDMESTVPGPLLYTTEEVIDAVKDIEGVKTRFADRYEAFYERFCGWEDGHASENIVKRVITGEK